MAWEAISVALKAIALLSAVVGLALPTLDALGWKLGDLSRGRLVATAALLLGLGLALGGLEHLLDARAQEPKGGRLRVQLRAEVLTDGRSSGTRLGLVGKALRLDAFAELRSRRERVAPGLGALASGYAKLKAEQRVAALTQAFAATPLHLDRAGNLLGLFVASEADPRDVRAYYDQLEEVARESEDLLRALRAAVDEPEGGAAELDQRVEALCLDSDLAHWRGLALLNTLRPAERAEIGRALEELRSLEPRRIVTKAELDARMPEITAAFERNRAAKEHVLAAKRDRLDRAFRDYAAIDERFKVQKGDSWNTVKAGSTSTS